MNFISDEDIPAFLLNFLEQNSSRTYTQFANETIKVHHDFRLYLVTFQTNPHFLPEIASNISLINFTSTEIGLKHQFLTTFIAEKRLDLQDQNEKIIFETAKNNEMLYKLESNILDVLSTSEGNILEDENAINILSNSKNMSDEINTKQMQYERIKINLDNEYMTYLPLAAYATSLYFCVMRMSNVNTMYQLTLDWFMKLFIENLRNNVYDTQKSHHSEQIAKIEKSFVRFIYRSLYQNFYSVDRLAFAFIVSIEIKRMEVKRKLLFFLLFLDDEGMNIIVYFTESNR